MLYCVCETLHRQRGPVNFLLSWIFSSEYFGTFRKTVPMPLFICVATYENSLEDDEFVTSGFLEYNFHLVPDCFPVDVNNVAAWDELWRIHSHFAATCASRGDDDPSVRFGVCLSGTPWGVDGLGLRGSGLGDG